MSNTPTIITKKSTGESVKDIATIAIGVGVLTLGYKVISVFGKGKETSLQEKKTDAAIKGIIVNSKNINANLLVYRTAVETIFNELSAHILIVDTYSFETILNAIKGFNTDELKQTVKEFGTRPSRLFNIIEVGGGGSLFDWCDAILNKDERETIKEIFVFTGLDKLPEMGMRLYFNYSDKGWFDKENKMRAVAALWKPFLKTTPAKTVYPIKGNSQYLNVLEQTGTTFTQRSIKCVGFGAIGKYTSYDSARISTNGIVEGIKIQVTDTRLKDWVGKSFWINSREINQTPPPTNRILYPL